MSSRRKISRRRGVSAIWTILTLPVMLCFLGVVIEVGNVYLARRELINALEAAALAGADEWGDAISNLEGDRDDARNRARTLFAANTVNGIAYAVDKNCFDGAGCGVIAACANNVNATCTGNVVILGAISGTSPYTFDASPCDLLVLGAIVDPSLARGDRGVRVQATISIDSLLERICGIDLGSFDVSGQATARYVPDALPSLGGTAELIRVATIICSDPTPGVGCIAPITPCSP